MRLTQLSIALFATWLSSGVLAHGGGLNAEGCHNNRKTGDYHCHRAPTAAPAPVTPIAPQQLKASYPSPAQAAVTPAHTPNMPTCYVGPRGGTYTITASGTKNYKGC